jgi:hypothetical protein
MKASFLLITPTAEIYIDYTVIDDIIEIFMKMSKKTYLLIALGLLWLISLVWLGPGPAGCQPARNHSLKAGLEDRQEWHGLYFNGQKAGYSVTLSRQLAGGGRAVSNKTFMMLPLMGTVQQVSTNLNYELDKTYNLSGFEFRMAGAAQLTVRGRVQDRKLLLEITSQGQTQQSTVDLAGPVGMPDALEPLLVGKSLEKGREYSYSIFDPASMSVVPMTIKVTGTETLEVNGENLPATKLAVSFSGSQSFSWVDSLGRSLREEGPLGLVMVLEDKRRALAMPDSFPQLDLLTSLAVPASGRALPDPRNTAEMTVRITGLDIKGLDVGGGRQQVTDSINNIVRISKEQIENLPTVNGNLNNFERYLAPTPLIQSQNPAIKELARKIVRGKKNSWDQALAIEAWVHDNLEKTMTVSLPSAVEVLASRRGDCNEHSTLYAALARAAGLPCRLCLGVVYLDGRFYYHAWNAVYCGQWIELDATFGQAPADAARLRLAEGDLTQQTRLLPAFGNLKLEILESK